MGEVKVLLEESTESTIGKWRSAQQVALKVSNDEELAWELERKSVSCRSQIDAKVAEIFGAADESGGAYTAQRTQELREREKSRIDRALKRKAWREAEYLKELERVESAEKKLRRDERERDDADRDAESAEVKPVEEEREDERERENGRGANVIRLADDQQLCEMVDRVQ